MEFASAELELAGKKSLSELFLAKSESSPLSQGSEEVVGVANVVTCASSIAPCVNQVFG